MPRKKLSLREQARLKRRVRQLEEVVQSMRYVQEAIQLTTWTGFGAELRREITTARTLGYRVQVEVSGENGLQFTAVKSESGYDRLRRFDREAR